MKPCIRYFGVPSLPDISQVAYRIVKVCVSAAMAARRPTRSESLTEVFTVRFWLDEDLSLASISNVLL